MTLYNSFVRPVTEYAAPVWSGALTNHDKSSIERIQKRALRIIMGHEYTTYHDVLSMGDLVSLEERRSSLCISFIEKTLKILLSLGSSSLLKSQTQGPEGNSGSMQNHIVRLQECRKVPSRIWFIY